MKPTESDVKQKKFYYANEAAFQMACVDAFGAIYPHLAHKLIHVPNGGKKPSKIITRKDGRSVRICPEGMKLKKMGVKGGVPDLLLFEKKLYINGKGVMCGHSGLAFELKSNKGDLRDSQNTWCETILPDCDWLVHQLWDTGCGTDEFLRFCSEYLNEK